jgi:inward rectifier potassium channel
MPHLTASPTCHTMPQTPDAAPKPDDRRRPFPPHRRIPLGSGTFVVTHGLKAPFGLDLYHRALTVRWRVFFVVAAILFLILNAVFGLIFLAGDHAIANQSPPGFLGAFFFSVETLATVGYGDMHPGSVYGHTVATIEIFLGMSGVALVTGLIFARFSRPYARIVFSKFPVVRPIDGRTTLMVRAANARQNVIAEATARLRMMRTETTAEGFSYRKVFELELVRDRHPVFQLGWTLMHVIDETSPLFGETGESLAARSAELMLTVEGIDETTMQGMQARGSWPPRMIRWNHRYADLLYEEDGVTHLDYSFFDDVVPL